MPSTAPALKGATLTWSDLGCERLVPTWSSLNMELRGPSRWTWKIWKARGSRTPERLLEGNQPCHPERRTVNGSHKKYVIGRGKIVVMWLWLFLYTPTYIATLSYYYHIATHTHTNVSSMMAESLSVLVTLYLKSLKLCPEHLRHGEGTFIELIQLSTHNSANMR